MASAQDFESSTSDSAVGYIDNAVIRNRFRFRFDHYSNTRNPDRAEYMFALPIAVNGRATQAIGPLDWQAYRAYTEIAFGPRFSLFGDFGIRDVDNAFAFDPIAQRSDTDQAGAADTFVGLRYGIIADQYEQLTAQLKVGVPTGDPRRCLGTGHTSIEAGLLYNLQRTDRLAIFGELKDWVSINAYGAGVPNENSSNVLSYGFGCGYDLLQPSKCCPSPRLTAVFEVLGWTVIEGLRSTGIPATVGVLVDANGETIVNAKYGLRYWQGKHSVYGGYGHSMTGSVWYEDVLRVEYTRNF
ncbi:MAG: hypothetical protein ACR2NM_05260 [Bythopirellula sp.]